MCFDWYKVKTSFIITPRTALTGAKFGYLIFLVQIVHTSLVAQPELREFSQVELKMGSRFEITAVSRDSARALASIHAAFQEVDRIEQLISSWLPSSQTSKINQLAGKQAVMVDDELFQLIRRSIKVSELSKGAFDITFAGTGQLWRFEKQEINDFPDSATVSGMRGKVGYRKLILDGDNQTVKLLQPGMKIGFGSIGKGYTANRARKLMIEMGIESGMVNAGGDLIAWGNDKDGKPWSVGIADPNISGRVLAWLTLEDMALVTSGDYEKYFTFRGQRFGHIIDPRTGYPVLGIKSVSIVCPDAELADALATTVYVMGEKQGMELINKLNGIEGLIVNFQNQLIISKNLSLNYYASE